MKVGFVGLGKLGLPVALAINSSGFQVCGTDVNADVHRYLLDREIPFREERIEPLLQHHDVQWLTSIAEVVQQANLIFVAVQTPHQPEYEGDAPLPDSRADFDYTRLCSAVEEIAKQCLEQDVHRVVAVISTCLPGTFERAIAPLLNDHVAYVYTPLFIAMGTVLEDYFYPEFNLIGVHDDDAADLMEDFYAAINTAPSLRTDITTAEGIKVSYNTWITAKTVIANAWGELSERLGMNFDDIHRAWSLADRRLLSNRYMRAGMSDGGGCFPPGEMVMTEIGPRPIETIAAGDRVLTIDGSLQPVIKTWKRDYDGEMVDVKIEGLPPARMTADHPVMARRDLRARYANGRKRTDVFPRSEVAEISAIDLSTDHLMTWPRPDTNAERPEYATDEYLELAGWYLSEGSVDLSTRRGRLRWDLHADERAEADRIAELAVTCAPERLNGRGATAKVTIASDGNSRSVRFGSMGLARQLVADFGKGARDKTLPSWLLWGDAKLGALVFRGMILGDGHIDASGIAYSTISPDLAWGAFTLITRLGIHATLRDIPPRVGGGGQAHQRAYEVRVRNRREARALADIVGLPFSGEGSYEVAADQWRPVRSLTRSPYTGPVHNLWVAGTNTYVVSCGAVHNCHPRDNIALSWLADAAGMSRNIWEDLMAARESYEAWHCEVLIEAAEERDQPIVLLGTAFKPETDIETGSPAMLMANILRSSGVRFMHCNDINPPLPAVYFIATQNARYAEMEFPPGSMVIDPFGYIPDRDGVVVKRLGRR